MEGFRKILKKHDKVGLGCAMGGGKSWSGWLVMRRDKVASQRYCPTSPQFITKGAPKILQFKAAFLLASHSASLQFLSPPLLLPTLPTPSPSLSDHLEQPEGSVLERDDRDQVPEQEGGEPGRCPRQGGGPLLSHLHGGGDERGHGRVVEFF